MTIVSRFNDIVADRIVTHQVGVLRLAAGAADEAMAIVRKADDDTVAALAPHTNDDGKITYRTDNLVAVARKINDDAYGKVRLLVRRELRNLAYYEVDFNSDLMNTHLPYSFQMSKPRRAESAAIVDEEPMAGGLIDEWVEGLSQGRFQRVRAELRISAGAQEKATETVRRLRGSRRLGYRDGVAQMSLRSISTFVKTAFNHVANKSRVDFYNKNNKKSKNEPIISGYIWSAVLDDTTCSQCAGLDGEFFKPDDFDFTPPAHPNCRCVAIPVFGDYDEYEFPRPRLLKYNDWLKNQPASMQDEILGAERAAMFRRGMKMHKFTDVSGTRYNLVELRHIEAKNMAKKSVVVSDLRKDTKQLKNFGWKPDIPDQRDHRFGLLHPKEVQLPARVSLRKGMPPVWDQGDLGSCVAHACIAAHMYVHKHDVMLSRLFVYWNARFLEDMVDEDSGVMIRSGVKSMVKFGACPETQWPYQIRRFRDDPPAAADKAGLAHRVSQYLRLSSLQDIQKCLAEGFPAVFGFSVYDNIYASSCERHGVLTMPPKAAALLGGHAVTITGYDSDFHRNPVFKKSGLKEKDVPALMFECRNSWGAKWGDAGYFWMPADYVNNRDLSDDFWTIRS